MENYHVYIGYEKMSTLLIMCKYINIYNINIIGYNYCDTEHLNKSISTNIYLFTTVSFIGTEGS